MIATTACGSSDEKFFPEDFAILDQFVDRTTKRCSTFIMEQQVALQMFVMFL